MKYYLKFTDFRGCGTEFHHSPYQIDTFELSIKPEMEQHNS